MPRQLIDLTTLRHASRPSFTRPSSTRSRLRPLSQRWHDLNRPQTFRTRRIGHSRHTLIGCSACLFCSREGQTSASATSGAFLPSVVHMTYVSPHPTQRMPYLAPSHLSALLQLPHAYPTAKFSLPPGPLERDAFEVREFVQECAIGTDGAFMWAVWDLESSRTRREVVTDLLYSYGYLPKPVPYAALKEVKWYA
ncbi:hypothetical protein EDB85DRAFT_1868566 [Lactarius pseudohatsudake]|nr:hypothetical protein EDB85DRAFT_1868566 [Lactarius pseudohatsudake]